MKKHGIELLTAASVDVRFHLKRKTATIHFHFSSRGRDHLVVTIPLRELERLYQKIDQLCRKKDGPFAPVAVRPRH